MSLVPVHLSNQPVVQCYLTAVKCQNLFMVPDRSIIIIKKYNQHKKVVFANGWLCSKTNVHS